MNAFAFLIAWYNIPFSAALGVGILLAGIQLAGGFGDSDADTDVDVDTDVDMDVDADADVDHHVHSVDHGGAVGMLASLGFGRLPFLLVLSALLGSLGILGLLLNSLLNTVIAEYPAWGFPLILIGAVIGALPLTGAISGVLSKLAPQTSTAIRFEQLVGRDGLVVSPRISQTYGQVSVRDIHGSLHTVFAVIESGEPLPSQSEVALVSYDADRNRFTVRALRR